MAGSSYMPLSMMNLQMNEKRGWEVRPLQPLQALSKCEALPDLALALASAIPLVRISTAGESGSDTTMTKTDKYRSYPPSF